MSATAPSDRSRVRRAPKRADYRRETVEAILDEAPVAHLGFTLDGQPYVIPTLHARVGRQVYIHGSAASRMIRTAAAGNPICLTVTLIDGLVLARSAFHHSMNYRSAVILGTARPVKHPAEKLTALKAFTDGLIPGRWAEVRPPNPQELKATNVLVMDLDEASTKTRTGGPIDNEDDYALDVWAGHIPLTLTAGAPVADTRLRAGIQPSPVVENLAAAYRGQAGGSSGLSPP